MKLQVDSCLFVGLFVNICYLSSSAKLRMPAFLATEARGCDYIVLWLDCDKEGENICFEVLDSSASF